MYMQFDLSRRCEHEIKIIHYFCFTPVNNVTSYSEREGERERDRRFLYLKGFKIFIGIPILINRSVSLTIHVHTGPKKKKIYVVPVTMVKKLLTVGWHEVFIFLNFLFWISGFYH